MGTKIDPSEVPEDDEELIAKLENDTDFRKRFASFAKRNRKLIPIPVASPDKHSRN